MKNIYVDRGGWVEVDLKDLIKGDRFTVAIDQTVKEANLLGDDIYLATEDAKMEGTTWVVSIDKPAQPRWTTEYLNELASRKIAIQVRGSTINSLDYSTVIG